MGADDGSGAGAEGVSGTLGTPGIAGSVDEGQLVELTSVIALENYRARFNWALGIQSEGYSEGAYCVAPQAAASSAHAS